MRLRGVTGTAVLCLILVGCTGPGSPATEPGGSDPVMRGPVDWQPPADAPAFCSVLAGARHVTDIPEAVGTLVADPTDTQQAWRLAQSTGELREARDAVRRGSGPAELAAALDDLVDALALAAAGPLDAGTKHRIADGLAAVGRHAQPSCEFPT